MGFATVFRARPPQARETHRAGGWSWACSCRSSPSECCGPSLARTALLTPLRRCDPAGRRFGRGDPRRPASSGAPVRIPGPPRRRSPPDHRGAYRYVRNPIYTALFASLSPPASLSAAVRPPRIRRALHSGNRRPHPYRGAPAARRVWPEFEAYARRVPALIPIPFRSAPV